MKIALQHQATKKVNNASCTVIEYPLNHEMLDFAIATISGRYPDARRVVNQQCAELGYVIEGSGKIVVNHKEYQLNAGDIVIIEPGEKYYWEGNMKLFLSCRPAWYKDQHQVVDL